MAFLLLLHQKMRLQRKQNQLTLKQMRFSSLVDRMQKKVDKREKYYAKLEKQLERQANYYKNNANMFFSQQMGMGTNSINLGNPYATNGAVQQIIQGMTQDQMQQMVGDKCKISAKMYEAIRSGCVQVATQDIKDEKGNIIVNKDSLYDPWTRKQITGISSEEAMQAGQVYQLLQQNANMQFSQMQQYASQMKSNYENNVSIWLEAQQEQLEAQKEWEMDLLAEEQADLEADKTSVETQLELVKQEKQNIEQALGQAIQDAAPKFGLT